MEVSCAREKDTVGSDTTTLIKQSFKILAQCPGVHRKRKGSSGRAEGKNGDRFPSCSLGGDREELLYPGQHRGMDGGMGRRKIVKSAGTRRLGCSRGVNVGLALGSAVCAQSAALGQESWS